MKLITESQSPYSLFYSNQDNQFVLYQNPIRAFAYYPSYRINLLTNAKEPFSKTELIQYFATKEFNSHKSLKIIWHWFYELSAFEMVDVDLDKDELLAIELNYEKSLRLTDRFIPNDPVELNLISQPNLEDYLKQFMEIKTELIKGNCYQLNLTHQFVYKFSKNYQPIDFFSLWKNKKDRGAFAHATFIPTLNKLFLSNSPECLMKKNRDSVSCFPIKGTVKPENKNELFNEKNCAELDMITDLMRNDLAKITGEIAQVVSKRKILRVPGLFHAYSEIKSKFARTLTLDDLRQNVFPGGSITGAPKKRVMNLIHRIEKLPRGFYCGSTVLLDGAVQSASINIRSASVDFSTNELRYGSGGGITLLSEASEEFRELIGKRDSFINLFSPSNIFLQ